MSEFYFGNVYGPVQTGDGWQFNAGRDQYVPDGNQSIAHGNLVVGRDALHELQILNAALPDLRLTSIERDQAEADLKAVEQAMQVEKPDSRAAASYLHAFTAALKEAGALTSSTAGVAESISKIAKGLGPVGAKVLALFF
jgi:hypothetical protein